MSTKLCAITNLERRPVTFRGKSGESFHLAPRESGREVRALEVDGNPMVEKLVARRVLAVEAVAPPKKKSRGRPAAKKRKAPSKAAAARKKTARKRASRKAAAKGGRGPR